MLVPSLVVAAAVLPAAAPIAAQDRGTLEVNAGIADRPLGLADRPFLFLGGGRIALNSRSAIRLDYTRHYSGDRQLGSFKAALSLFMP